MDTRIQRSVCIEPKDVSEAFEELPDANWDLHCEEQSAHLLQACNFFVDGG